MAGTTARAGVGDASGYRRAFTLIELLIVILIITILLGIMLPAIARGRKSAKVAVCESNMRQVAMGLMNYAGDSKGWLGVFSWKPNTNHSIWPDLNGANASYLAHAYQAVDIERRVMKEGPGQQPAVTDRMLSRNYSYMPLVDGGYLADGLPNRAVVCPEDRDAMIWQQNFSHNPVNPMDIVNGTPDPDPAASPAFHRFLAFWSTYQTVPAAWSDQTGGGALSQGNSATPGYHLLYYWYPAPTQNFFNTTLDRVWFPSQKVYLFDLFDRHLYKRTLFHAYPDARQPLAFFDGSVNVKRTADANPGWDPTNPTSNMAFTSYYYYPTAGEPRTFSGNVYDAVKGYYRWTRKGIRGVDFGGGEVLYR